MNPLRLVERAGAGIGLPRWIGVLIAAGVTAATMVGCSSNSPGADIGSTVDPMTATTPATPGAAAHLITTSTGQVSIPWTLRGLSNNGRRLEITFQVGSPGCNRLVGVDLRQSNSKVWMAVLTSPVGNHSACAGDAVGYDQYVTLKSTLGKRRLVHAPIALRGKQTFTHPYVSSKWTKRGVAHAEVESGVDLDRSRVVT